MRKHSGRTPMRRLAKTAPGTVLAAFRALSPPNRPGVEAYHDIHRALRLIRIELSVARRFLKPRYRAALRSLDREIRQVARLVGEVRDRDVGLRLLRVPRRLQPPVRGGTGVPALRRALLEEARIGRRFLAAHVRPDRRARVAERLAVLLARGAEASPARWGKAMRAERHRRSLRLRRIHRAAARRPSSRRLHLFRSRLRALRLLDEAAFRAGGRTRTHARTLKRLQRALGELHDLELLTERLARAKDPQRVAAWRAAVEGQRAARTEALVSQLRTREVRRALKALAHSQAGGRRVILRAGGRSPRGARRRPAAPSRHGRATGRRRR